MLVLGRREGQSIMVGDTEVKLTGHWPEKRAMVEVRGEEILLPIHVEIVFGDFSLYYAGKHKDHVHTAKIGITAPRSVNIWRKESRQCSISTVKRSAGMASRY